MNKNDMNPETLERWKQGYLSAAKGNKLEVGAIIDAVTNAGEELSDDDIIDALEMMGIKNTPLTLDQFIDLLLILREPESIIDAFKGIDKDGKGVIEEDDFRAILRKYAPDLKGKEIEDIIENAKASNNGKMNYTDFVHYWANA